MPKANGGEDDALDKMVRFNQLMDLYGDLLTERQRRMARLHFEEDLSFGEIAEREGVSRQAAHDAAKHARLSLEKFEKHLGLLDRQSPAGPGEAPAAASPDEAKAILLDLRDRLRRSSGVIYSPDWIVKEIERALEAL